MKNDTQIEPERTIPIEGDDKTSTNDSTATNYFPTQLPSDIFTNREQTAQEKIEAFQERVESNQDAASGILDILTGVPYKLLAWKAGGIIESKSDIKDTLEPIKPSSKSQQAAADALARIFARHTQSSEAMDYAVIAAFLAELSLGFAITWKTLSRIEAKIATETKPEKEPKSK